MNRVRIALNAVLAIWMVVTAIGCSQKQPSTSTPPMEPLSVAYSLSPAAAPFLVATEKDFWSEEFIKLDPKEFLVGRMCLDAVLAGNADIGTVAETPLVYAALGDAKFYVLSTITNSTEHQRCLARRDRGIAEANNLRGKKVAAYLGTASEFHMDEFLRAHNLHRDEIEVINLKPPEMVNALVSGQVDAAFVWEPFASEIEARLGSNATIFPVSQFYTMTFNIVCRKEFVEQRPELAAKILRVLLRTTQFMHGNRVESVGIVAKKLGVKTELLEKIWDGYKYDVRLDQTLLESLRKQAAWVRQREPNLKENHVSFRTFLYDRPLRLINPSAVSLPTDSSEEKGSR